MFVSRVAKPRLLASFGRRNLSSSAQTVGGLPVFTGSSNPGPREETLLIDGAPLLWSLVYQYGPDEKKVKGVLVQTLKRVLDKRKPTYAAFVIDSPGSRIAKQQSIKDFQRVAIERNSSVAIRQLSEIAVADMHEARKHQRDSPNIKIATDSNVESASNQLWNMILREEKLQGDAQLSKSLLDKIAGMSGDLHASGTISHESHTKIQEIIERTQDERLEIEYKGNRVATTSSSVVRSLMESLKEMDEFQSVIRVFANPRTEADDVIATLTKISLGFSPSSTVVISSSDKDFFQLFVSDRVAMLRGTKALLRGDDVIDHRWVQKELGIPATAFIDYQALMGDSADNIPGIKGIGPIRARKLIQEFGTLDAILDAANSRGKTSVMWSEISRSSDVAMLCREMVTLNQNLLLAIPSTFQTWKDALRVKPSIGSTSRKKKVALGAFEAASQASGA